ncbi:hypothetical protein [Leisingera daeponensis]|uniref:hypothetical protein n=1 Tax=Leisingera daeponensis TaxID=405746 RepID=UPI001C98891E|nr:hypothetical protein [Leisingera daeponensis]MBY6059307.1 hypothetical protein [Leisingera daeponensis]
MPSILVFTALPGVVVKNSILLLGFVKRKHRNASMWQRRKGGSNFAAQADNEGPVWRHRLHRGDERAASAIECCVSKHLEGQWQQSPAICQFEHLAEMDRFIT